MVWGWMRDGNPWSRQRPVPRVTILKDSTLYVSVRKTIWRHLKGGFPRSQPLRFSEGPRTGPRNLHFSKPHAFPSESAAVGEEALGKTPAVRF